jgi:predicted flap endonuclease-1-like 5' DNA nuclease
LFSGFTADFFKGEHMNSLYSFHFPGAPDSFLGDLVTADAIQQHWLQTGAQLQRNWIDNTRDFFSYCQTLAQDSQRLQSMFFKQYVDWFKGWSGLFAPSAVPPSKEASPVVPEVVLKSTDAEPAESETPLLLGWVVDDLTRIQGVGKVLQQRLYEEGIVSYLQIASWDEQEIARIENEVLGSRFAGRVFRDQWQAQAEELMQG